MPRQLNAAKHPPQYSKNSMSAMKAQRMHIKLNQGSGVYRRSLEKEHIGDLVKSGRMSKTHLDKEDKGCNMEEVARCAEIWRFQQCLIPCG